LGETKPRPEGYSNRGPALVIVSSGKKGKDRLYLKSKVLKSPDARVSGKGASFGEEDSITGILRGTKFKQNQEGFKKKLLPVAEDELGDRLPTRLSGRLYTNKSGKSSKSLLGGGGGG